MDDADDNYHSSYECNEYPRMGVKCGARPVFFYTVAPNKRTNWFETWCFGRCAEHRCSQAHLKANHHTREIPEAELAVFEVHFS